MTPKRARLPPIIGTAQPFIRWGRLENCVNEGTEPELLYDVAALLITSAALGHAVEASSAPAASSISQVVDIPFLGINAGPSAIVIDPAAVSHPVSISTFEVPQAPAANLGSLTGISLLRALSALPAGQTAAYVSSHPAVVSQLLAHPPAAVEVADWWGALAASERATLAASSPRLVGNLDGVPVSVRDSANRNWVAESIASMHAAVARVGARAVNQNDQHALHMLQQVEGVLASGKNGPPRSLLSVDSGGAGKAAVVIGNLQTADYVTYMVPGMFFTVDGQVGDWTGDALDLYDQQTAWLKRLAAVDPADSGKTVAVVAWMGYQTPDLTNIGSLDFAYKGRDALASLIEGEQALRATDEPYTTIVAHSYGSTAALMALTEYNFSVDALVLVGSPGSAAQSVHDLHVRNANVFVGSAPWDPVPASAWFGSDPAAPSYGAKTMAVGGAVDAITGKSLGASIGHNNYFSAGSESVRNMALVGIDHGELVMSATPADAQKTLALG
ncbi:alpha/beta hydrolase [Tardiphaga sp.]|uniref:alpha/beta hydrolase n=1 Tax=Tardiphaga sp. TaxID=1926292 RepID=UPI002627DCB4|nr:alpha/beta hydrolase [Tardiphaga sp.]MDB5621367.1 hypothetical protein [Tardiphaga sp.]